MGFGRYIQSKKYLSEWPIICQMSNGQTAGLWRRCIKKELDIMSLHIMGSILRPHNVYKMFLSNLDDPHATSLCLNLLMSSSLLHP